ncbi:MAG: alpha/beta fold hydrolase [Gammaproteobacteria bacterium]|nr:alpha/beta fold hydrolase [Gammaproteobacteria bacterium]
MTNPTSFPLVTSRFFIAGPDGQIEVATTTPNTPSKKQVMIVCHPHPLYLGSMDNKVVTTLMRVFNEMDFYTVRFNFRGVGKSEGTFADGIGETDDLLAVLDWVKRTLPDHELWLAGFSFGAYIAYRAATITSYKDKIKQLICVAPPASYPEFKNLPEPTMPWLVVQGEEDEVIDAELVFAWITGFAAAPQLIRMPQTSHFFHGKLVELKERLKKAFS